MPEPSKRTRRKKRYSLQLPGGRAGTHYKREKVGSSRCSRCGKRLSGIPRLIPSQVSKLSASQRKVERMHGGQLCHDCLRDLLRQRVRSAHAL
ncbi:MAG: 50S ribosomal protein L34e [Candidatus Bathyarchaeia archaeon]